MTTVLAAAGLLLGILIGLAAPYARRRRRAPPQATAASQILLPFTGTTLSRRALEAAIRLAKVEHATLMPAFLATVPLTLSLESPLPRQCTIGMPLLEAIEQRATAAGTRQLDRSGRVAKLPAPNLKRIQVLVTPAEGNLQGSVQMG